MLMAARSSGGSPQWTRRPFPSAHRRPVTRDAVPVALIAGFMAPTQASGGRKTKSDLVIDSGSDADEEGASGAVEDVETDEWEDLGRGENAHAKNSEQSDADDDDEPVAFRDARFCDEDDGSGSEYTPSDIEDDSVMVTEAESAPELDEEVDSVAGLFAKYLPRRRRSSNKLGIARSLVLPPWRGGKASSDSDDGSFNEQDARLWSSAQEKEQWVSRYRAADRAFRRSYGCSIESEALPEAKRRLRRERTLRPAYMAVVLALIALYAMQLAGISLADLSPLPLLSMIGMRGEEAIGNFFSGHVDDGASEASLAVEREAAQASSFVADEVETAVESEGRPTSGSLSDAVSSGEAAPIDEPATVFSVEEVKDQLPMSEEAPLDYTKAAIDLCGHLLYRVVASHHNEKVAQNAASACDIAVRLASYGSLDGAVAHAQRGDLRSVLAEFEAADADYAVAALGLLSAASSTDSHDDEAALSMLQSAVDVKAIANRWVQLYMSRDTDELVREVSLAVASREEMTASIVSNLAADWIGVFKREKSVVEALTALRVWTLRRLSDVAQPPKR